MAITINGSGTITGVSAGGLPDDSVVTADIAADAIDGTKLADNAVDSEHYTDGSADNVHLATGMAASKLTGALPAISGAALTDTIYDIGFTAGFDSDMVKEDVAVATYGEMVMARAGTFIGEAGYVDTAATGAILIVDIMKNGTTIYATTKPQFAISATGLTAGVLTVTTFAAADRITFKVTQIGSTEPGEGVRFTLKCKV